MSVVGPVTVLVNKNYPHNKFYAIWLDYATCGRHVVKYAYGPIDGGITFGVKKTMGSFSQMDANATELMQEKIRGGYSRAFAADRTYILNKLYAYSPVHAPLVIKQVRNRTTTEKINFLKSALRSIADGSLFEANHKAKTALADVDAKIPV